MSPKVSVVTPVYNGSPYLRECIESVLKQTYTDFEYVISDNHSTDDTPEVIAEFAATDERIRVVRPETFLDQIPHWNFAARCCLETTPYVKFVCADDGLAPTCLEQMVDLMERHPSVGAVGSLREIIGGDPDLDGIPPGVEVVPGRWLARSQLRGAPFIFGSPTSTLVRGDFARRKPAMYDETYVHADDALIYAILREADFGYISEPLTRTRRQEGSYTGWSERVGTWTPEHLRMALEFGPDVLTARELQRVVSRYEERYTRTLTKWAVTLKLVRESDTRRFHREALAAIADTSRRAGRPMTRALAVFASLLATR